MPKKVRSIRTNYSGQPQHPQPFTPRLQILLVLVSFIAVLMRWLDCSIDLTYDAIAIPFFRCVLCRWSVNVVNAMLLNSLSR